MISHYNNMNGEQVWKVTRTELNLNNVLHQTNKHIVLNKKIRYAI